MTTQMVRPVPTPLGDGEMYARTRAVIWVTAVLTVNLDDSSRSQQSKAESRIYKHTRERERRRVSLFLLENSVALVSDRSFLFN